MASLTWSSDSKVETSALGWCTGKTQWVWVEREVGGGNRDGDYMADSCQCMTKNHYSIEK